MRLCLLVLVALLALPGCAGRIDSATTCADLTDALAAELDALPADAASLDEAATWEAAAARAGQILEENPEDPGAEACDRVMRAARDGEADKFRGE